MFACVFPRLCPAFGGRIQQPLTVVLVATHADLADIPRAFSGEFSYDKEKVLLKEVRNRLGFKPQQTGVILRSFCCCLFVFLIYFYCNAEANGSVIN